MGTPIKVGDSFSNYENIKNLSFSIAANSYNNANLTSTYSTRKFYVSLRNGDCAMGELYGKKKAIVILSGLHDDKCSVYTTEYKPKNFKQDARQLKFTTIYDYGIDDATGKWFYLKAEDKNGNNIVDTNEITYFNSQKEMMDSKKH